MGVGSIVNSRRPVVAPRADIVESAIIVDVACTDSKPEENERRLELIIIRHP